MVINIPADVTELAVGSGVVNSTTLPKGVVQNRVSTMVWRGGASLARRKAPSRTDISSLYSRSRSANSILPPKQRPGQTFNQALHVDYHIDYMVFFLELFLPFG
jgi:hypothetical protein